MVTQPPEEFHPDYPGRCSGVEAFGTGRNRETRPGAAQ